MLGEDIQDLPCHRYYQFVPIRDTDIGGVIKDCGLRSNMAANEVVRESAFNDVGADNASMMQPRRRFSY